MKVQTVVYLLFITFFNVNAIDINAIVIKREKVKHDFISDIMKVIVNYYADMASFNITSSEISQGITNNFIKLFVETTASTKISEYTEKNIITTETSQDIQNCTSQTFATNMTTTEFSKDIENSSASTFSTNITTTEVSQDMFLSFFKLFATKRIPIKSSPVATDISYNKNMLERHQEEAKDVPIYKQKIMKLKEIIPANIDLEATERKVYADINCYNKYYEYVEDDVQFADENNFPMKEGSIFFIESSCRGTLDMREACSVESAAQAHPNRDIVVLFVGPVSSTFLQDPAIKAITMYKNVHFYRIRLNKYVRSTPINMIMREVQNKSRYPVNHIANLLKYATLFKFGGIALDLDVLVVKSFDSLPKGDNWIGVENYRAMEIGIGLIGISRNVAGRNFINSILSHIADNFNLDPWRDTANEATEASLEEICGIWIKKIYRGISVICEGIAIYEENVFYPVYYTDAEQYFESTLDMEKLLKSYALHTYSSITHKYPIVENSTYAGLMKRLCPYVERKLKKRILANKVNFDLVRYFRNVG